MAKKRGHFQPIVSFKQKGDFEKTDHFLHSITERWNTHKLDKYGRRGVEALRAATPRDTGKTAESWSYEIVEQPGRTSIYWRNSNVVNDWANVAILIQYGHATRNGGWVEGRDYINPAIQPIFDQMADEIWKEVVTV